MGKSWTWKCDKCGKNGNPWGGDFCTGCGASWKGSSPPGSPDKRGQANRQAAKLTETAHALKEECAESALASQTSQETAEPTDAQNRAALKKKQAELKGTLETLAEDFLSFCKLIDRSIDRFCDVSEAEIFCENVTELADPD